MLDAWNRVGSRPRRRRGQGALVSGQGGGAHARRYPGWKPGGTRTSWRNRWRWRRSSGSREELLVRVMRGEPRTRASTSSAAGAVAHPTRRSNEKPARREERETPPRRRRNAVSPRGLDLRRGAALSLGIARLSASFRVARFHLRRSRDSAAAASLVRVVPFARPQPKAPRDRDVARDGEIVGVHGVLRVTLQYQRRAARPGPAARGGPPSRRACRRVCTAEGAWSDVAGEGVVTRRDLLVHVARDARHLARGAVLALHAEIIAEDLDEELFEVLERVCRPCS